MIVMIAVGNWRYGKAMLDQAERLFERRHALRQGRLFIHLTKEKLSIEELEKAFNWNVNKDNAFSSMPTDASAPWGAAINELTKTIPKIIESSAAAGVRKSEGR